MNSEIDALKGNKPMDESHSSDPSSATPGFTSEPIYGMPPNSFPGQIPPPSSVYATPVGPVTSTVGPVRPVRPANQPVRPVTQG